MDFHRRDNTAESIQSVGSAATTPLASATSSKGHSFEDGRRLADTELERLEQQRGLRERVGSLDSLTWRDEWEEEEQTSLYKDRRIANIASTFVGNGEARPPAGQSQSAAGKVEPKAVRWSEMPKKGQLTILTLARLSEPLTQTSLQSYMFYQLKSFSSPDGTTPSDAQVAQQAGMLAAAFTGTQFLTAMMWGRLADSERMGRKRVILIGLLGTAVGSVGFGFSRSFADAMLWRMIGGVLNGNIGVMRTMISEIIKEKKYQSRAFLLLPMTFNIGVIIGPLLGGLLADPVRSYPGLFGQNGMFGQVTLFERFPYALPNLVNAAFLVLSTLALTLGLQETLEGLRDRPDWGLSLGGLFLKIVVGRRMTGRQDYALLRAGEDRDDEDMELSESSMRQETKPAMRQKLPFHRIWTRNVLFTLLAHGLLATHVGTFNSLWFVFLSTPRFDPKDKSTDQLPLPAGYQLKPPFVFTGGLALSPPAIGTALAILGVIGISLQLLVYPRLSFQLGTIQSYRVSLLLFPISYCLAPFLAIIPSTLAPPHQASGLPVWVGITAVLAIQVLGRTFALPSTAILVNNSSPHPSVLGTLHGIAQSVSSAARTVGPVLAGWIYGVGLNEGVVGLAWWCMAAVAVLGAFAGRWVKEGDGHEIWLEGEEEGDEARDKQ